MFKSLSFSMGKESKRNYILVCEVLFREFMHCVAHSHKIADIEFISQGWHDLESSEMKRRLQEKIDSIDESRYGAILLGFGLCNNGTAGLEARKIPVVIPKVHDCISILLGSHDKYLDNFSDAPGTYYLSSGWIERDSANLEDMKNTVMSKLGLDMTYDQYVEKYGKENADFIMESLGGGMSNYEKMIFVNNGLGNVEFYRNFTRSRAEENNLKFEEMEGGLDFVRKMVDGDWNSTDFLVIEPGCKMVATGLCDIMKLEKCHCGK